MDTRGDSDRDAVNPPAPLVPTPVGSESGSSSPHGLDAPRRSFLADFLALAAMGFLMFGVGFSYLAARSRPYESFTDILWSTGIWSGLVFGALLGLVFGLVLKPRASSFSVESPDGFRSRLYEALPRAKQRVVQESGTDILLGPVRRPPLPILAEETTLIRISGKQVTVIGGRMTLSNLKRKVGGW